MKKNYFLMIVLFLIGSLQSCTIEKQLCIQSHNIEWKNDECINNKGLNSEHETAQTETTSNENPEINNQDATASIVNSIKTPVSPRFELNEKQGKDVKEPRIKNKKAGKNKATGGKSQIVALILCILLGWIGVHRFYLGYTGTGIIYLFTLGLFLIGWLIDLILLIIPNGLTPKGKTNYRE